MNKEWPQWDGDKSGHLNNAEARKALTAMLNDIEYGLGDLSDEQFS